MQIHPAIGDAIAPPGMWHVDATQSEIRFAIRHVMVSTVIGRFAGFDGTLDVGHDGTASATGTIEAATIDTNEPVRDACLRSADFFDVARHPTITFTSTAIEQLGDRRFRILGELEILGVTHDIELEAVAHTNSDDGSESARTTLELRGELSHRALGVGRQALQASRVLLGDKIKIAADISVAKYAATNGRMAA